MMWGHCSDRNRIIRSLKEALSAFSLDEVLSFEETLDEQYRALSYLHRKLTDKAKLMPLAALNALVSYQLSGTGEQYWWEFAEWFSKNEPEDVISGIVEFVKASKYNARLRDVKIRRLLKTSPIAKALLGEGRRYFEEPLELWRLIYSTMGSKPEAKTIVFSVKMANYAGRIVFGKRRALPYEIPIPLDSRILSISRALCVKDNEALRFWSSIAREVGIPPLHLDSLLWVGIRLADKGDNLPDDKVRRLVGSLKSFWSRAEKFIRIQRVGVRHSSKIKKQKGAKLKNFTSS